MPAGRVYKVTKPGLKLWRVTSEFITARAMGGWWSASKADDEFTSRKRWRTGNSVCTLWNPKAQLHLLLHSVQGRLHPGGQHPERRLPQAERGQHFPTSTTQQLTLNDRQHLTLSQCSTPLPIRRWTD
jgi:hypothetical protein